ncbi:DUF814 domain-containing protein [Helicobacter trogontum]|uniref:DUF814 domain-containing protein n=1 Tax=Helicobacter trogontum TaxID=50960 RepID=A0A4U8THC5_9HELI|nr:DUF814 domain-containing protein [Helicobacter trogontum]TLD98177.1 DUF814 domain-containing protein [Helicobacter trogontum]
MKLQQLHDISRLFCSHKMITYIARINDNVIHMRLDDINYFIDLNKGDPRIYSHDNMLKTKHYNAPFDVAMNKYIYKAHIQTCKLDGMNKILKIYCIYKSTYKSVETLFQIELINRATNAIILQNDRIISALRFIDSTKRAILPKTLLTPLAQPHFSKTFIDSSNEDTLKALKEEYNNMQKALLDQKREKVLHSLESKKAKLTQSMESLPNIETLTREKDMNFMLANYILTHLDSIPNYATSLTIGTTAYNIPCTNRPSLASDKLFKQTKKLKQKIEHIHKQQENLESKIIFLNHQIDFAKYANDESLSILLPKKHNTKKLQKNHYANFYIDGVRISVGRNERENIRLLQDSKGDFLWLHICDIPSSHLIIHANKVSNQVLEHAGILLAKLCGIKDNKIVIDYTKRRFVRLTQGAHVVYAKESKLHLQLNKE